MEKVNVICKNSNICIEVPLGTTLAQIAKKHNFLTITDKHNNQLPVLAALVDNTLKDLNFPIYLPHTIEFIGLNHPDGRRCYIRSLCFVLQNAVSKIFPNKTLIIDHSLPNGLYCKIQEIYKNKEGINPIYNITIEEIETIKQYMLDIVSKDYKFNKEKILLPKAVDMFRRQHQTDKAELLQSLGKFFYSIYSLNERKDTFYGPLLVSTKYLTTFNLMSFGKGFCLQLPSIDNFNNITATRSQSKIAEALEEYSHWIETINITGVGTLNNAISAGKAVDIINLAEVFQARKYADIANKIYEKKEQIKIVFIAGPSSSGKTSSALRLALELKVLGIVPKVIELDNYFVDREHTPKDENGEYDFEALQAMDLKLLNRQLNALLEGKEVDIPKFDFKTGKRSFEENIMTLGKKDVLIMEGIHALNPKMVAEVDNSKVFRVYASALTSLNIDENNNISTSDNRLLRRMVRDNRVRGIAPEDTILRWHSVRSGEEKNIFPFQENSDAVLNSALLYELPMLKYYAEPLLRRISPCSPAYAEAVRLLKFLEYIVALQPNEIEAIPPTSIMREFIGGQTL